MINRRPQFAALNDSEHESGVSVRPDEVVISENFRLRFLRTMIGAKDGVKTGLVQVSSRIPDFDVLMERVQRQSDYLSALLGVKLVDEEVNLHPEPHLKVQMTRANAENLYARLTHERLNDARFDTRSLLHEDPYEEIEIRKANRRRRNPVQMHLWERRLAS